MASISRGLALARARPLALVAALVLIAIAGAAVFADVIALQDPLAQDVGQRLRPPGPQHYFGTDGFGRDIFSRVLHGARASLFVGAASVAIASGAGIALGTLSAYAGGKADLLAQRAVDVLMGFPFLVLALITVVAVGPSQVSVAIAVAIALAPQVARLSRASALSVKGESYMEAAQVLGAGPWRTLWRHLLPNSLPPVVAQVTGYFGVAVAGETTLSFLGLGVPPPYPSWGRMLQEGARQYFEAAPWATIFPGLAMSATILSAAFLGDALRDLMDPRRWSTAGAGPDEKGRDLAQTSRV